MEQFKTFIRKQGLWIAFLLCLLAVFTWSSGGNLVSGAIACAITAYVNYLILKWLLPERAETLFVRGSNFSKWLLLYLGVAVLMFGLSLARTGLPESLTIDLGAVITFLILGAAETFLILGPVLHLMMNRYAQDDVGVFQAVLFTGLAYGLCYFLYGFMYLTDLQGTAMLTVIAQGLYISLSWMFLATIFLMTENFFLILAFRMLALVLERGTEAISDAPVGLYTLSSFKGFDCVMVIIFALAFGVIALNLSTDLPPWPSGDFKKRKKRSAAPLPMQNPRLEDHKEPRRKK